MTQADTGKAISMSDTPVKTVQVFGTFGAAGAITMEGSNDVGQSAGSWFTLKDWQDADIVLTTSKLVAIRENPLYVRPRGSAGTGVTLSVVIVGAKGSR